MYRICWHWRKYIPRDLQWRKQSMTQQTQNTIGDIVSWSTFLGKKYGLYFFVLTLFSICLSDGNFFCNIWFKWCYYCISLVELVIYHAFRSLSFTYSVLSLAQKLRLERFVENKKALGDWVWWTFSVAGISEAWHLYKKNKAILALYLRRLDEPNMHFWMLTGWASWLLLYMLHDKGLLRKMWHTHDTYGQIFYSLKQLNLAVQRVVSIWKSMSWFDDLNLFGCLVVVMSSMRSYVSKLHSMWSYIYECLDTWLDLCRSLLLFSNQRNNCLSLVAYRPTWLINIQPSCKNDTPLFGANCIMTSDLVFNSCSHPTSLICPIHISGMHVSLETLLRDNEFKMTIKDLVVKSGRSSP